MKTVLRRGGVALVGVIALVLAGTIPSQAHSFIIRVADGAIDNPVATHAHHQHGGEHGHLPAGQENVELIAKANIKRPQPGRIADVAVFGNYAYLAAFWEPSCEEGGVYVFDLTKLHKPKQIKFIPTGENSYVGEGVHVVHVDTPHFTGDVLAFNNEICGPEHTTGPFRTVGGMTLVDVSNPKKPKYLTRGFGDFDNWGDRANQIHSVFAWTTEDRAYAVLVDNEEATDVDIVDISDPRNPELIAEHDLAAMFPQILQPGLDEVFLHDMVVKEIDGRQIMLASYWDAGYVLIDVTDPLNPVYVGDSDFADPDPVLLAATGEARPPEGNGHQAEFTLDNEFVIASDEDFSPYALAASNLDDGTDLSASLGSDTPSLAPDESLTGQSVFGGRACDGDPAVPTGDGSQIAVVERGVCTFTEKVANVEAAGGYVGVLIFNRAGPAGGCNASLGMNVAGGIPTFGVAPRGQGYAIFDIAYDDEQCLADDGTGLAPIALGAVGDTLTFSSYFDGWGYVHLYRNQQGKLAELDTYAIPEAHDPDYADGFGDLSVHEVATSHQDASLAYLSYYSGGLRVLRIVDEQLVEVGHFIDEGGNNFWGVDVFERDGVEYVAASDRDHGLYIFRYTGS